MFVWADLKVHLIEIKKILQSDFLAKWILKNKGILSSKVCGKGGFGTTFFSVRFIVKDV